LSTRWESILSKALVRALYGPKHYPNDNFAIITGVVPKIENDNIENFATHAIVYTNQSSGDWQIVKTGKMSSCVDWAVENFAEQLRDDFGCLVGQSGCYEM
jgi:hypothetical protein